MFYALNGGPFGTGEYLQASVNGSPYSLTASDILSYSYCPAGSSGPCYLNSGKLYGPIGALHSSYNHNGGDFQISVCSGINSFSITCDGSWYGICFDLWADTTSLVCSLTASNNGPICSEDSLKLVATGDTSIAYHWYGPGGFTSTMQNPVIPSASMADTGAYYVVQIIGGVTDTAWTHVTVNAKPSVSASSNGPLCEGQNLLLFADTLVPGETFVWSGPGGFGSTLQDPTRNTVSVADSGPYQVIATLNGCKDTSTVSVIVKPRPIVTASGPGQICETQTLFLFSGPYTPSETFLWTGPGAFSSTIQNPVITGVSPGSATFTVVATINGCKDTETVNVLISTELMAVAGANTPLCEGQTLQLTCTPFTGTETYNWTGPAGFSNTQQNPSINNITGAASGVYTVIANNGCQDTARVNVEVRPLPDISASCDSIICPGTPAHLFAVTLTPGVSFTWTGPNQFSSNLQNPLLPDSATNSSGLFIVTATALGCSKSDSVVIEPVDMLQSLHDTTVCREIPISVNLSANVPVGGSVTWSTGSTTPSITATAIGPYTVTVKYKDCETSTSMLLESHTCNCFISVPDAFTPNNDGKNDYLRPIIPADCHASNYSFSVFNRWGQLVFFSTSLGEKWDGSYSGIPCELGIYMFVVRCDFEDGKDHYSRKGDVTLIR